MTATTAEPTVLEPLDHAGRARLFTEARTANTFAPTPVTDAELQEVWDLARWSPSAANSQPLRVLFVRSPEGKQRLLTHLNDGNKAKTEAAPAVAVLAFDPDWHRRMPELFPARGEGMRDAFEADPEGRATMGGYSAALQTGVFLLAVRAVGLAAGPMAGFDRAGLDADFFADSGWRSHLVVNIGHPGEDPWFPRLPRLDAEQALAWA
ncbi:MAG: malonic semialdehyde reductase [Nocardioides sp.]|nr:malonic semialdehyde reductase [Nocardioides sp.]